MPIVINSVHCNIVKENSIQSHDAQSQVNNGGASPFNGNVDVLGHESQSQINACMENIDAVSDEVTPQQSECVSNMAMLFDINGIYGDTFVSTIHTTIQIDDLDKVVVRCELFNKWWAQSKYNFGFVPLSDSVLPDNMTSSVNILCPIQLHKKG